MSYDAQETSQRAGAPLELYRFAYGDNRYFYTSADEEQTYLGDLYTPEVLTRTEISQSGESEQGSVEVTIPRTNPVAQLFISYPPEPPLGVTVYRKHRSDPEVVTFFAGTVSSVVFTGAVAKLTCLPLFESLRRRVPRNTYQVQCNWALYSAQCGVVSANFRVTAQVTVISGDTIQATAFSAQPDGWFNNGWVERANGERRWIVNHVGATLTLMSPFVGLAVNEEVFAFAGCDRTEAVCKTKFNNIANHLGFARVPTKNPFQLGLG